MKQYKDLNKSQQRLFNKIEQAFINQKDATQVDFVTALGVLINKHKIKGKKESGGKNGFKS